MSRIESASRLASRHIASMALYEACDIINTLIDESLAEKPLEHSIEDIAAFDRRTGMRIVQRELMKQAHKYEEEICLK